MKELQSYLPKTSLLGSWESLVSGDVICYEAECDPRGPHDQRIEQNLRLSSGCHMYTAGNKMNV